MRFIYLSIIILIFASCGDDDRITDPIVANPGEELEQEEETDTNDGRQPCEAGFAGIYPCEGYDLMANITLTELNAQGNGNDIWGWTDPTTGNEYALMGTRSGTVFVDITNPIEPIILGKLDTNNESSLWRDIKVYNDHAFIVSEAPTHGMQVFDLTRLRGLTGNPVENFTPDTIYTEFGNAHNIAINEDSGYAYVVGTETFSGGPHFINIQNPKNPIFEGGFADGTYSHDAQVVTYTGPDIEHRGKEIFVGSNETEIVVIDVTDKSNPVLLSTTIYPNTAYTHQGWFTEDQTYFIVNDELDERDFGFNTRTLIFDFFDLDNPTFFTTHEGPNEATDHNLYVKGDEVFLSNYTAGVRVASLTQIMDGDLVDTGRFDTFPESNATGFQGVWSVYPYFESGNIILSDINGGLFIIRKSGT